MQVFVELPRKLLIPGSPTNLVLVEAEGVGEDLLAEGALIVHVFASNFLLVSLQVLVLDLVLVLLGLNVDLSSCISQSSRVFDVGFVGLGDHPSLSYVV